MPNPVEFSSSHFTLIFNLNTFQFFYNGNSGSDLAWIQESLEEYEMFFELEEAFEKELEV